MKAVLIILVCLLSSCSAGLALAGREQDAVINENQQIDSELSPAREKMPPIKAKILKAYLDQEENFKVKVLLEPATRIDSKDVLLTLQGLKEGEIVDKDQQLLSNLTPFDTLREKQSIAVILQLNSSDFSEYQVKLSWGDDARQADEMNAGLSPESETTRELAKANDKVEQGDSRAKLSDENLLLEEQEVFSNPALNISSNISSEKYDCASEPCQIYYEMAAELSSLAKHDISNIKLAIGIYWQPNDSEIEFPKNFSKQTKREKIIDLGLVTLVPGEVKKINLSVDRPVPVSSKGKYLPHVRILSAEAIR